MKKLLTEKRKKSIIVFFILWLVLAIVFVLPAAVASVDSSTPNGLDMESFKSIIGDYILNISVRVKAFQTNYFGKNYFEQTKIYFGYYSFFYAGVMLILFLKSKDKGKYRDIEHGSSDWCEGGEQYTVLSKKEGIILAQKNYLPVDKKGNVNVLIVGRIWCW